MKHNPVSTKRSFEIDGLIYETGNWDLTRFEFKMDFEVYSKLQQP